jgi:hypothetical protein
MKGLQPDIGAMSTIVTGEAKEVFLALHEAFDRAAVTGHVVMTVGIKRLSNLSHWVSCTRSRISLAANGRSLHLHEPMARKTVESIYA